MHVVKRAIVILAVVLGVLAALAIRVVVEGRNAMADGAAANDRGRPAEAIRAYETAARWYLPLAPHVDEAYRELRALAASTDPAVSLAAWRSIRAAARATRSLWTPHAEDLAAADAAIASSSVQVPQAATTDPAWHRERLARDPRASVGGLALAALGILLWAFGAIALVRRGLDGSGGLVRRPALASGIVILLGVVCWAAGLYNA
jgi:hypothetical protein